MPLLEEAAALLTVLCSYPSRQDLPACLYAQANDST